MKSKITKIAVSSAAIVALALSACTETSSSSQVTIQMVEWFTNPDRSIFLKGIIADFEKVNPNIKVELVSPPTEQAQSKIEQMLQAGSGIDVFEVPLTNLVSYRANKWVYDMTPEFANWDGWNNLTSDSVKFAKANGGVFLMPYGYYKEALFYRSDLVKKAGFSAPPSNWEELLVQSKKIQGSAPNTYGYAFRGGRNGSSNMMSSIWGYAANEIDLTNIYKLKNGNTMFNSPLAKQALETYFSLFKEASPPSSVAWGYPEMVEGFSNGSTAFLIQSQEVIGILKTSTVIKEDQWSTTPMLTGPGGKMAVSFGPSGWATAASSEHKAEAAKLIQYLASFDVSVKFSKEVGVIPPVKGADQSDFYQSGPWKAYVTMANEPDKYLLGTGPTYTWAADFNAYADTQCQEVEVGKISIDDLLKNLDKYLTDKFVAGTP